MRRTDQINKISNRLFPLLMASLLLFSSCAMNYEDPTNIELEVLRASLLEKELTIDELHQSLDQKNAATIELNQTISELERALSKELALNQSLLEGKNELLIIQESKQHYFDIVGEDLYILKVHHNAKYDYTYEELVRHRNNNTGEVIYKGSDLSFDIDRTRNNIIIQDRNIYVIKSNSLDTLFEMNFKTIEQPELDFLKQTGAENEFELLYNNKLKNQSLVLITEAKPTEAVETPVAGQPFSQTKPKLKAIVWVDYTKLEAVTVVAQLIQAQTYQFSAANNYLLYQNQAGELVELDLLNRNQAVLEKAQTQEFKLHLKEEKIHYYSEAEGKIKEYQKQ